MQKSIAKNLMYNLLLQVTTLVLPLITLPYVSRILGAEGIGTYSYTLAITQYFIIMGTLGLTMYGNRQIAYTRDNKEQMSGVFWSILLLMTMTTGLATVLYVVIFWHAQANKVVYMTQTLNIVAAMIDISWLYMGLEDFKKTVTRSLAVKIIGVSLIFLLVKAKSDLYLYVLINALMVLLGNLVMWMYLPKVVSKVKLRLSDITDHFWPATQLFIPQIAIQIYVVLDKTMLGAMTNVEQVGYLAQSQKIIKAVLGLVTALGIVMLPRMSNIFANGDRETMDSYLNKSLKWVAYVAVPMTVGIASIANEFVPLFFGPGFGPVTYLMQVLAPILFFIAMSNVMGVQYLLPTNRTKEFTASVTAGAVVNVMLNLILIPQMKALGAGIATVVAEFSITAVQYYRLRREVDAKAFLRGFVKYIVAAAIMFVVVRVLGTSMGIGIMTTLVQCSVGLFVYVAVLTILREEINAQLFGIVMCWIGKTGGRVLGRLSRCSRRKTMRKNHLDVRIVGLTFIIAVMIIIALYLRTNGGFKPSSNPPVTAAQAESSQSMPTPAQSSQDQTAQNAMHQPINSKIVTVGDSFTYGNPVGPGYSWPKWIADHLRIPVTNQGKVGQTSQDVLAHFDQDVVAAKPGRVIIFVGDGDAIKGVSIPDYQNAIRAMVAKARAHQIIPILALPLPYRGFEQRIKTMQDWLSSYAKKEKIQTLDFATVLFDSKGEYLKGMSNDGKYPSLQGYEAMGKYAVGVLGQDEGMNVRALAGIQ